MMKDSYAVKLTPVGDGISLKRKHLTSCYYVFYDASKMFGKSKLQVPDTGTRVLDNTRSFLCSSIVSF